MATHVFTDADVTVNGVDLSDHVQSVTVDLGRETSDSTAMGHDSRTEDPGLRMNSVQVTFLQDFAAASVDATIYALFEAATEHMVVVKPTSGALAATNPSYSLTGFVNAYNPISGSVGDQHTADVAWTNSAPAGATRATS